MLKFQYADNYVYWYFNVCPYECTKNRLLSCKSLSGWRHFRALLQCVCVCLFVCVCVCEFCGYRFRCFHPNRDLATGKNTVSQSHCLVLCSCVIFSFVDTDSDLKSLHPHTGKKTGCCLVLCACVAMDADAEENSKAPPVRRDLQERRRFIKVALCTCSITSFIFIQIQRRAPK